MIPEPSRRPFPYPLDVESLRCCCHPRNEVFRRPVRDAAGVWAANGYVAVRVTRGILTFDDTIPEPYPEFTVAMQRLPWDLLTGDGAAGAVWRKLDDHRGTIYRGGPDRILPLWENGRMTEDCPVMTAASCLVPLAMLQLLARLPRAEMRMQTGDFLAVRFSGGEALVPGRWRHHAVKPPARFALLRTKDDLADSRDRGR